MLVPTGPVRLSGSTVYSWGVSFLQKQQHMLSLYLLLLIFYPKKKDMIQTNVAGGHEKSSTTLTRPWPLQSSSFSARSALGSPCQQEPTRSLQE